ncbi:uncharacterized protein LOC101896036 isoform X3 [Musca domestica]|uniref:Uncharacterized protein LOC101896036 isoform X3 n=1 Tax=Musca domestica TaxID=7370 RepID=A0ABM3V980_MUSDO|nr:uncharacterized protein LOC101896036 isoform X3 [Musca domestica]
MFSKSPVLNIASKNMHIAKKCYSLLIKSRTIHGGGVSKTKFRPVIKMSPNFSGFEKFCMRPMSSNGKENDNSNKSMGEKKSSEILEIKPISKSLVNQLNSKLSKQETTEKGNQVPPEPRTILKKVFKKRSRQESRDALHDPTNVLTRRRGSKRRIMIVQLLENTENSSNSNTLEPSDLKTKNYKLEILADHEGIGKSMLTPKKVHIEFMEEDNLKDIELEKNPSLQLPPTAQTSVAIKNDTKKAIFNAETDQLTKIKYSKDSQEQVTNHKFSNDNQVLAKNSSGYQKDIPSKTADVTKNIVPEPNKKDEKLPESTKQPINPISLSPLVTDNKTSNHKQLFKDDGQLQNFLVDSMKSSKASETSMSMANLSSTNAKKIDFTKDEIKLNSSNTKSDDSESIFLMSLPPQGSLNKHKEMKKAENPTKITKPSSSTQDDLLKVNSLSKTTTRNDASKNIPKKMENSKLDVNKKTETTDSHNTKPNYNTASASMPKVSQLAEPNRALQNKMEVNTNMKGIPKPLEPIKRDVQKDSPKSVNKCPKNMFGECMSAEQLKQNQEKLKIFQKAQKPQINPVPGKNLGGPDGGNRSKLKGINTPPKGSYEKTWSTLTISIMYVGLSLMIYGFIQTNLSLNLWQNILKSLQGHQLQQEKLLVQKALYQNDTKVSNTENDENIEKPPKKLEAKEVAAVDLVGNLKEV